MVTDMMSQVPLNYSPTIVAKILIVCRHTLYNQCNECFFNFPVELELNLLSSKVKLLMKMESNV